MRPYRRGLRAESQVARGGKQSRPPSSLSASTWPQLQASVGRARVPQHELASERSAAKFSIEQLRGHNWKLEICWNRRKLNKAGRISRVVKLPSSEDQRAQAVPAEVPLSGACCARPRWLHFSLGILLPVLCNTLIKADLPTGTFRSGVQHGNGRPRLQPKSNGKSNTWGKASERSSSALCRASTQSPLACRRCQVAFSYGNNSSAKP